MSLTNSKSSIIFILLLVTLLVSCNHSANTSNSQTEKVVTKEKTIPQPKETQLAIKVALDIPKQNEYILKAEITNFGQTPIEVYLDNLPWRSRHSILLILVKADEKKQIPEVLTIDDPGITTTVIEPGKTLSGSITLPERFPNLLNSLSESDHFLFWSYQLKPIHGPASERFFGGLIIPKQTH